MGKNQQENYKCYDCGCEILIEKDEIKNGKLLNYETGESKEIIQVFKCNDCFEKNPSLTNFQECEVYSRIVGYIRPIKQWNDGKKVEYYQRKEYKKLE